MKRFRPALGSFAPLVFAILCLIPLVAVGAEEEKTSKNTPPGRADFS